MILKPVDYSTVEECKIEDMRKDLFMTDIPVKYFPLQLGTVQQGIHREADHTGRA